MAYVVRKKQTLLIPSGPANDPFRNHLFVIATDRCYNHQHLLMPICTIHTSRFHDPTCKVAGGLHSSLPLNSYVEYRLIKQHHCAHIEKCADALSFVPKDDVEDTLFQ